MEIPVETPQGVGVIEKITISDLNYLMVRVRHRDSWVNYPICDMSKLLENKDIKINQKLEIESISF